MEWLVYIWNPCKEKNKIYHCKTNPETFTIHVYIQCFFTSFKSKSLRSFWFIIMKKDLILSKQSFEYWLTWMSICNKYQPILLSQILILNKTDTFALSSLPRDTKDYQKVFNNLPNDIHSEKIIFNAQRQTIDNLLGLKCVWK